MLLTNHCNLQCRGCRYFSPISPKKYASLEKYNRDILRLKELFSNIKIFQFLGGEPLLNPYIASFIILTRDVFPNSEIRILTNGSLLTRMNETFYSACRDSNVIIYCTVYPPLSKKIAAIEDFLRAKKLSLSIQKYAVRMQKTLNLKGSSLKEEVFNKCRNYAYNPVLRDGFIYHCSMPATVRYFNKRFNQNIIVDKGINIHSPFISGYSIIKRLNRPIETCRWCTNKSTEVPWGISKKTIEEWDDSVSC
jgi:organic radical activating enzyme